MATENSSQGAGVLDTVYGLKLHSYGSCNLWQHTDINTHTLQMYLLFDSDNWKFDKGSSSKFVVDDKFICMQG